MAKLKVRYFVCRKEKSGKERFYWQPDTILRDAGWKMRRLSDDKSLAISEAEEINQNVDQWRAKLIDEPVNNKPGTMDAVITKYKKSRHYLDKSENTKKDYLYYLTLISKWAGDTPAEAINAKMVQDLYETLREQKPRKAAYLIQVLRLVFSFAERESLIPKNTNPATRPALAYKASKGKIWSHEAVLHFVKTADAMGQFSIGTAVMLNEWLGQRRGDLISLPMNAYRNGNLYINQSKTKANVTLPVDAVPELKLRIETQILRNKKRDGKIIGTALIQERGGKAYTDEGMKSGFERIRIEAAKTMPEISKLVFKDLRHTAVTRLAEAGAEIPMIAAVTGHTFKSAQEIVDRYNIRTTKMASEAFSRRLQSEGVK